MPQFSRDPGISLFCIMMVRPWPLAFRFKVCKCYLCVPFQCVPFLHTGPLVPLKSKSEWSKLSSYVLGESPVPSWIYLRILRGLLYSWSLLVWNLKGLHGTSCFLKLLSSLCLALNIVPLLDVSENYQNR